MSFLQNIASISLQNTTYKERPIFNRHIEFEFTHTSISNLPIVHYFNVIGNVEGIDYFVHLCKESIQSARPIIIDISLNYNGCRLTTGEAILFKLSNFEAQGKVIKEIDETFITFVVTCVMSNP